MDTRQECLIEMLEDLQPTEDTGEVSECGPMSTEISLHAFSGTYNPRTIRVTKWFEGKPLTIFVDNGSTHNFIQDSV